VREKKPKHKTKANWVRTRDIEEPVSLPSNVSDERKELDVALVQGLILTTEGEDTAKFFLLSSLIIQESGKPEAHFGGCQLAALSKRLPERSGAGVGDGLEGKTQDTGIGAV